MTDAQRWAAVLANDENCDGLFYYAVSTTRIFCRPSCKSKPPLRAHITYFDDADSAQAAGYRPCKRCRPDLRDHETMPISDIAPMLLCTAGRDISNALRAQGYSPRALGACIKSETGMTLSRHVSQLKIESAMADLRDTDASILTIAHDLGYNSLSAFYRMFAQYAGTSPAAYRRQQRS